AGKPVNIRLRTGRSPILAFGNSSDDIQMLESAGAGGLPSLALTLRHDDAEREYAYDKGAEKMIEVASENGWVIVSMKEDFKTVFENIDD
ncbi:MAG: haloacid dehalogenase-like hydrolase, partial [Candidatus Omnitrophica bacterium]|nr:haloacid dehalogenase-like hydrolase [Candidatus Omnitrophota bacterium]